MGAIFQPSKLQWRWCCSSLERYLCQAGLGLPGDLTSTPSLPSLPVPRLGHSSETLLDCCSVTSNTHSASLYTGTIGTPYHIPLILVFLILLLALVSLCFSLSSSVFISLCLSTPMLPSSFSFSLSYLPNFFFHSSLASGPPSLLCFPVSPVNPSSLYGLPGCCCLLHDICSDRSVLQLAAGHVGWCFSLLCINYWRKVVMLDRLVELGWWMVSIASHC